MEKQVNKQIFIFFKTVFITFVFYNVLLADYKFIFLGHSSGLVTPQNVDSLIIDINKEKPDCVFILGDSDIWKDDVYKNWESKINTSIYYVPGNHDLFNDRKEKYINNVGYLENVIVTDDINFILINSSEDLQSLKKSLKKTHNKLENNSNLTILLTHHRIWDDNLLSDHPYQHDKSYLYNDIRELLLGRVDYIIAGNSPRQYFQGTYFLDNYQQNGDIVYWCDYIDNIWCYSIGMGNNNYATYIEGTFNNETGLQLKPKSSFNFNSYKENDYIKNDLIEIQNNNIIFLDWLNYLFLIITSETFLLGAFFGILITYYYKKII